jgi:hypothetical protein
MLHVSHLLESHPQHDAARQGVEECIEACFDCAAACTVCADACLGEDSVQDLVHCIRLNLNCADICQATARVMSRYVEGGRGTADAQLRRASTSALPARRSGSGTPATWSIAASAPRHAASARRLASGCWPRSAHSAVRPTRALHQPSTRWGPPCFRAHSRERNN